jgi:hypothetical protein
MLGALGFLVLLTAFYGFAFGATRLLLRRSSWEQYTFEAAWLTGPALVILSLSLLAYRVPTALPAWQAWLLLACGWAVSLAVAIWERRELLPLAREHWRRWLTLVVPALLAAAVLLWFFRGNAWDDVSIPFVNEYINYAELAATLTGHHQGEPGGTVFPFCAIHRPLRCGQDLVVATVAQLAGRHPLQVVVPVAALFRFQQTIVLGLLLSALTGGARRRLVFALLAIDAVLNIELVAFGSSFLSSNCTMPLFALYLVWLACQVDFGRRQVVALVLMNLFFLLTYPEFLVPAKAFESLALAVALWRRNRAHWRGLVLCNLAVVLLHPLLVADKARTVVAMQFPQVNSAGWNAVGDPVRQPVDFAAGLVGFRYGGLQYDPLRSVPWLSYPIGIVVLGCMVVGAVLLARRYRAGLMLLAWALGLVAVHVGGAARENYYVGFKILSHTYFVLILGAGAALAAVPAHRRALNVALLVFWLGLAAVSTQRLMLVHHREGYVVSYTELRDVVARAAGGREVAVLVKHVGPFMMLNCVSGERNVPVAAVKPDDRQVIQSWALGRSRVCAPAPDGTLFRGLVLVDPDVLRQGTLTVNGQTLEFACGRVVDHVGALTLCEGRVTQAPRAP